MPRKKGGKKGPPKKSPYKRPPPIPKGEIIKDSFTNKTWTLGETVGVGGFGDIYSACPNEGPEKGHYNYVVKVEPQENGPLFVEKHFYIRNAKESDIKDYMKTNKMKSLGMPTFFGHGFHECNGEKYRYLVLERYGTNVWDHFEKCNKSFSPDTVFLLGLQMLEVLNYIHGRGYVHADIKGTNILMGLKKGTENQAYLVDYGLAARLTNKEYVENPKAAHDGTLDYVSRDGHKGAQTMRSDLEILAYNMLHWLIGTLPWMKSAYQPSTVMTMKTNFMSQVRENIQKDYPLVPDALIQFFEYIDKLGPMETPDYGKCQKMFLDYLKSVGKTRNSKLEFKPYHKSVNGDSDETDANSKVKEAGKIETKRRGRKPKAKVDTARADSIVIPDSDDDDIENKSVAAKQNKRKQENLLPIVRIKKMKMSEVVTPPAKENHANIATQTSVDSRRSPRFVSFNSPVSEVINDSALPADTSRDIFDESYVENKSVGAKKRKLLSTKEETVTKVVKKKVTSTKKKGKSWKDAPSIVNGRSLRN